MLINNNAVSREKCILQLLMDVNRRQINNPPKTSTFDSHLHFSTFAPDFFESDRAINGKIIYCSLLLYTAWLARRDATSDNKSISKSAERAFEFACSTKLNDEVDSSGKRQQMLAFFVSHFLLVFVLSVWSPLKISLFITATNKRLAEERQNDSVMNVCKHAVPLILGDAFV